MSVHLRWGLATLAVVAGSVALTWVVATRHSPAAPSDASAPSDDPINLVFVYSEALTSTLEARTDKGLVLDTLDLRTSNGRRIEVTRVGMSSQQMVERVLNGSLRPHIILPSSDIYLDMADKEWSLRTGKPLLSEKVTLAYQPHVLAVRRPMAEAMGWPGKEIGWSEVVEIARNGWKAVGHPEWGPLKLLDANPEFSDSGLQAVVSVAQSILGSPKGLKPRDRLERLKDPKLMETFQALDKANVSKPPCHMAFVPEHIVIDLNDRNAHRKVPPAWVAIYPKGGTITEDITAGIIQREWVTEAHREAAALVLKQLREPRVQKRVVARGFRPALKEVALAAPIDEAWGVNPKAGTDLTGMPPVEEVLECQAVWQEACKGSIVAVSGTDPAIKPANVSEPGAARRAAATSGKNSRITPVIQCTRKCKPSTVFIKAAGGKRLGSGFIVDPRGYVITNYHVVGEDKTVSLQVGDASDKPRVGTVVHTEPDGDLALVLIKGSDKHPTIKFSNSDDVELGQQVVVIGNPLGYSFTVTVGIISGMDREIPTASGSVVKNVFQTDASINPGNSGGPVLDMDTGELIGIASAIHRGAENIGFVIPANQALKMWKAVGKK